MKMRRLSVCAAVVAAGGAGAARGQVYTWTGAAGANWFLPGSWSPMAVPPIGAEVVIPAGLAERVRLEGGAGQEVDLVRLDTAFGVDVRRELTVANGTMVNPGLDIADPARAFLVMGTMTLSGMDSVWLAGTLGGGGEFRNEGTLAVGGGTERRATGCTLRNTGVMRLAPASARIDLYRGGLIANEGTLELQGTQGVVDGAQLDGGGVLMNPGVLRATGIGEPWVSCGFVNTGRVEVAGSGGSGVRIRFNGRSQDYRGGVVSLSGGGVMTVVKSSASGAERPRLGGRVEGMGDFVIGAFGQYVVAEEMVADLAPESASGLVIDAGTLNPTIELQADLENLGKATWRSGIVTGVAGGPGVLRNRASGSLTVAANGYSMLQGASVRNEGTLALAGLLRVDGGTIVNDAAATVRVQGNGGFQGMQPAAAFTNQGTLVKEGAGLSTFSGGTFSSAGTVRVMQGGSLGIQSAMPQIVNGELMGGTWIAEPGGQLSILSGPITKIGAGTTVEALSPSAPWMAGIRENRGWIIANASGGISGLFKNLEHARLTIRPSVTMSAGSPMQNGEPGDGAALIETLPAVAPQTPGRVQVQVLDNYGRLAPGGAGAAAPFTLTGTLTMRPGSRLLVEIGGTGAGEADEMVCSGDANLGGTLDLSLIGGFVPAAGQEFVVVRASGNAGVIGVFGFVTQPAGMPPGLAFSLVYGQRTVTARVGPACYANCDGSAGLPALNVNDLVCFSQRFAAGDPWADCDQSGTLNVADFVCFQGAFAAGCP